MQIIKEFCPYAKTAVIRSNSYGSQLDKFEAFAEVAIADFPELSLSSESFKVVEYGGERYSRTFGIEFYVGNYAPEEYTRISQLELTK